jgi:hypothetical protein
MDRVYGAMDHGNHGGPLVHHGLVAISSCGAQRSGDSSDGSSLWWFRKREEVGAVLIVRGGGGTGSVGRWCWTAVDGGVQWRGVLSRNWHSGGRLGLSPFIGLCSKARWREAANVECIFNGCQCFGFGFKEGRRRAGVLFQGEEGRRRGVMLSFSCRGGRYDSA